jgi:hypothetical protein
MGGHKAWKKRVANGELAKGMGGAIMRHRPHVGPKGVDEIAKQKRGYSNPKKKSSKSKEIRLEGTDAERDMEVTGKATTPAGVWSGWHLTAAVLVSSLLVATLLSGLVKFLRQR